MTPCRALSPVPGGRARHGVRPFPLQAIRCKGIVYTATHRNGEKGTDMARTVETSEYVGMVRRVIRALGRRVADGDPVDLAAAVEAQRELDAVIRASVLAMRETHGFSWQQIGDELGVTRQAAFQKYGR